jgi:hypothetical protein
MKDFRFVFDELSSEEVQMNWWGEMLANPD